MEEIRVQRCHPFPLPWSLDKWHKTEWKMTDLRRPECKWILIQFFVLRAFYWFHQTKSKLNEFWSFIKNRGDDAIHKLNFPPPNQSRGVPHAMSEGDYYGTFMYLRFSFTVSYSWSLEKCKIFCLEFFRDIVFWTLF